MKQEKLIMIKCNNNYNQKKMNYRKIILMKKILLNKKINLYKKKQKIFKK